MTAAPQQPAPQPAPQQPAPQPAPQQPAATQQPFAPQKAYAAQPTDQIVKITFSSRETGELANLGQRYSRTFQIWNSGKVASYLKIKKPDLSADGNSVDWEYILKSEDWLDGNDGYWYRPQPLAKGAVATINLDLAVPHNLNFRVTKTRTPVEEYVVAEAVQAEEYIPGSDLPPAPTPAPAPIPAPTPAPQPAPRQLAPANTAPYRDAFNDDSLAHDTAITSTVSEGTFFKDPEFLTPLANPSMLSKTVNQITDEFTNAVTVSVWPYVAVIAVIAACGGYEIREKILKKKTAKLAMAQSAADAYGATTAQDYGYEGEGRNE